MRRRVVITGMGAITPLGHSVPTMFEAQLAGKSGVGPIRRFQAETFPTHFAAEVKDFELSRHVSGAGAGAIRRQQPVRRRRRPAGPCRRRRARRWPR